MDFVYSSNRPERWRGLIDYDIRLALLGTRLFSYTLFFLFSTLIFRYSISHFRWLYIGIKKNRIFFFFFFFFRYVDVIQTQSIHKWRYIKHSLDAKQITLNHPNSFVLKKTQQYFIKNNPNNSWFSRIILNSYWNKRYSPWKNFSTLIWWKKIFIWLPGIRTIKWFTKQHISVWISVKEPLHTDRLNCCPKIRIDKP